MAKRYQLSRRKGWRKPDGVVTVARPTKWGNPFTVAAFEKVVGTSFATRIVLDAFRSALQSGVLQVSCDDIRRELRGRDLACWCRLGDHCHADVLLEIANS